MDITFGLWADGAAWPDHGGPPEGSLGSPVVGPSAMVDLLETSLGLSGPPASSLERIVAWQAKLEAADGPGRFWARSLAADPWATARVLLAWRDDLVDAGWDPGEPHAASRLADLAAAESTDAALPPGLADRLRGVQAAIEAGGRAGVRSVRLIDARGHLPPAWRRLHDALGRAGVEVVEIEPAPAADPSTSLGRLQRWMASGGNPAWTADGSVLIGRSASTLHAAEVVRQWFGARPDDRATVLVAQGGDTHALDQAMAAGGQPRFGASPASAFRGSLQVLSLAFQLAWRPLDVRALMDLLTLPHAPVAPGPASRLASALEEAPGIGGERWREAWAAIDDRTLEQSGDDAGERAKAQERLARWRSWVEPVQADPDGGLATEDAVATCDRVSAWATARFVTSEDPLYRSTARLAGQVRAALLASGRARLPKPWVDRVVDQALSDGDRDPNTWPEAAPWQAVHHPGAIWGPVDAVVWWGFRDGGERPARFPWSAAERAELEARGSELDAAARSARALTAAWERAVTHARGRLILVTAGLDADAEEAAHPLSHRMAPATRRVARVARLEDALAAASFAFGGATLPRRAVRRTALAAPRATWPTPAGFAARVDGRRESATSLESLLACQFQWALQHVGRLRPGRARSIPDENRLLGNLAHALAHEIFVPGPAPTREAATARAEALLERFVDEMAAPLRREEHAVAFVQARRVLPAAIGQLAATLRSNRLEVVATEQGLEADPPAGPPLRGVIDLIARDPSGAPVVVDLKWTRSRTSRLRELSDGKAVQLATYGAMTSDGGAPRAGYFLLKQREFLTPAGAGLDGTPVAGARDLAATWDAVVAGWAAWGERARAGVLRARGLDLAEGDAPDVDALEREVHCAWCDSATLCRRKGA